ncbi:MAG: M28 family peptidase [Planctomycetota bacterium]|nr:MAG: M28 family peptidase [Planctomycetota bacterium]
MPALALLLLALPQDGTLLSPELRRLFHEELSGEIAKEHVIQITRHHRVQASRGYRDAARYVLEQLRRYGYSESQAWIESFPSDGRVVHQTWQSPSGWHVESAELRMVEPADECIVRYPEIAMSLVTYSNPGDVTTELVWVGSGEREDDYTGKDVRGKFVLATGYGGAVHRLAVLQHGAAAVVCYLDDERAMQYPDMLQYTGMWPRTEELARTTFGFNLTRRQGERLRALLQEGRKVVLRGRVQGPGLEPFFLDVVVARITGSERPDEELVFSAHLDHPKESANDNASGSGAILDVARGLRALIDSGRLQRPARTLTFLWVPEWHGTMAYIDQHPELRGPELGGKVLANMNLDMVGEHLELLHSKLVLTRTPDSLPSVVNDVIIDMAAMVDRMDVRTPRGSLSAFNYRVTPYSGGSDHMMFIDRKIPAVMFSHDPDYTHHTSEDTPDKVDPVELERCELIATCALWYLANLDEDQALHLLRVAEASAAARVRQSFPIWPSAYPDVAGMRATEEVIAHAMARGGLVAHWSQAALGSVASFCSTPAVQAAIERSCARLRQQHKSYLQEGGWGEAELHQLPPQDERVPQRGTRGPLAFDLPERQLPPERASWYGSPDFPFDGDMRFELVNFVDGVSNVSAVAQALSAEFRPVPDAAVARYLEDLVSVGVLRWKE